MLSKMGTVLAYDKKLLLIIENTIKDSPISRYHNIYDINASIL